MGLWLAHAFVSLWVETNADNPTREEVKKKRERNKAKWGLKKEDITKIVIPTLAAKDTSTLAVKVLKCRMFFHLTLGAELSQGWVKLETS